MSEGRQFFSAAADGNWSFGIKLLDVAIQASRSVDGSSSALVALLLNRGFCNQRLQLYRKALKVGIMCDGFMQGCSACFLSQSWWL